MNKLINGDCFKVIKDLEDNSIDLIVIDPPYEFTGGGSRGCFGADKREYHKEYSKLDFSKRVQRSELTFISNGFDLSLLDELCRVMKKINIYIWCSKAQVSKILNYFESKGCNIDILTWHKTNPIPTCNNTYLSDTEYCIFARENGVKLYGTYATKKKYYVTPTNVKDKKLYKHPTIKPLNIIENLVINSSKENDTILDCFMGSGTTGVACKNLNRNFIGIELDKGFYDIAKNRMN